MTRINGTNSVDRRTADVTRICAHVINTAAVAVCLKNEIQSTTLKLQVTCKSTLLKHTRGSAIAEEPRDALRQLKYYGRFLTELLTRSSANPEESCEHTVS